MTTTPFLMFQNGQCAPALDFYVATLPETRIRRASPIPPERPAATA